MWQRRSPCPAIDLRSPSKRRRTKFSQPPGAIHRFGQLQSTAVSFPDNADRVVVIRPKCGNHWPERVGAMQTRCLGSSDRKGLRVLCAMQRYRLHGSPTVGHRATELSLTLRFTRRRHRLVTHSAQYPPNSPCWFPWSRSCDDYREPTFTCFANPALILGAECHPNVREVDLPVVTRRHQPAQLSAGGV